ncbi:MAG: 50S ribosomal protein L16 [Saprospiraceae bacterium]|nr:50S ribosomal protein L16 [Saprospiraceae bacterium]MCC7505511.1 50S ribosomal protein L16 [Saprospiraceae bacterium]
MLQPKRQKYRKQHKGRNNGLAYKGSSISFGSFGLKAMEFSRLTSRQIEAARVALTRNMKREGKVWIRVFPDKPITSKPAEVRMGKGKGAVDHYVCEVQPGRVIFEIEGVSQELAYESLRLAAQKLPIICKAVTRYDFEG